MSGHGDLQELLRIFTSRKIPMMTAMKSVQTLQAKDLKTIDQIAQAPLSTVEAALNDTKLARSIHTACKSHGKQGQGNNKRPADSSLSSAAVTHKKIKLEPHRHDLDYSSLSPDELESSLTLPLVQEEEAVRGTRVVTNRAPLVLAFATELLRFTMPEQPPSSRLSLAQALVSANSKSKAVSLGIEKGPAGDSNAISEGQPRIKIMGREIAVLKRGGYAWKEEGTVNNEPEEASTTIPQTQSASQSWTASRKVTSRESTFIAHAASLSSPNGRAEKMKQLMSSKSELETATHNAWAVRTRYGNSPLVQEASFDDGEQGCGKFLLQVMREADVVNTVVVLTRWYGGIMLGPDRWRIMRECVNEAISSQRRVGAVLSGADALWGLDMEDNKVTTSTSGLGIHRPEAARNYLFRSFATAASDAESSPGKKSAAVLAEDRQQNLGKLFGALRLLFQSWKDTLSRQELDSRAWSWYVTVRPEVEHGPAGWGAKGVLELDQILDLRRKKS